MIDIKVQRVPASCPACGEPVAEDAAALCVRCRRPHHAACWERSGCRACPSKSPPTAPEPPLEVPAEAAHRSQRPPGEAPRWLDDPSNVKTLAKLVYVASAALIAVELLGSAELGYHKHGHALIGTDTRFAFYPLAGFIAYSLVVVLGMGLQKLVQREEDYYDE